MLLREFSAQSFFELIVEFGPRNIIEQVIADPASFYNLVIESLSPGFAQ
jgi:hypothetical protein